MADGSGNFPDPNQVIAFQLVSTDPITAEQKAAFLKDIQDILDMYGATVAPPAQ